MKNGCPECEKLPDGVLCDSCHLGYLEATAYAAAQDYKNAVDKYIEKLKEKKDNEHTRPKTEQIPDATGY